MAMRWRVSPGDWQPNQPHLMDRNGAKWVDQDENRRRLCANELDAQIGTRGAILMINSLTEQIERQARHVGVWSRWKAAIAQLMKMQHEMLEKTSVEQLLSIKNNTQRMKISMTPEGLPGDTENFVLPKKEHERLLCAALCYCQYQCDGSAKCQHGCRIKRMLDENSYIQDCDFTVLDSGTCKYNMADVAWERIRG